MSLSVKLALSMSIALLIALIFTFAHKMIAPGDLIAAHASLNKDCFACHTSLKGVQSNKCTTCHNPSEIGVLTSKGVPITSQTKSIAFHQKLLTQDCMSCHSDHAGVSRYKKRSQFNHNQLDSNTVQQCQSCHKAPNCQDPPDHKPF